MWQPRPPDPRWQPPGVGQAWNPLAWLEAAGTAIGNVASTVAETVQAVQEAVQHLPDTAARALFTTPAREPPPAPSLPPPPTPPLLPEAALVEQYRPDPLRRLQEIGEHFTQAPAQAALETIALPFEALNTATQYLMGAGLAAYQQLQGRYGTDLGRRIGELAAESATTPGADLPVLGGPVRLGAIGARGLVEAAGTAGTVARDIATGQVPPYVPPPPEARVSRFGPFGAHQFPAEGPDPTDPGARLAYLQAITQGQVPPPLIFAAEMLGPGPFAAGKLARGAVSLGGRALEAVVGPQTLRPVAGAPGLTTLGQILERPAVHTGVPLAVTAKAIQEAVQTPEGEERSVEEQLLRAGATALAGLGVTALSRHLAQTAGQRLQARAVRVPEPPPPVPGIPRDPVTELLYTQQAGRARAQAGVAAPETTPLYPGGAPRQVWDRVKRWLLDDLAPLETFEQYIRREAPDLGPETRPALQARLVAGVPARGQWWLQNELAPLLRRGGLTWDLVPEFDALRHAEFAISAMEHRRVPLGGFATREEITAWEQARAISDPTRRQAAIQEALAAPLARARQARDTMLAEIDARHGPGTGARLQQLGQEMSNRITDLILHELEDSRLLGPGAAERIAARVPYYAVLRRAEEMHDELIQVKVPAQYTAMRSGLGTLHPETDPGVVDLGQDVERITKLLLLAQRNRVVNALVEARDQVPSLRQVIRDWPAHQARDVPTGWGRVPYIRDEVYQEILVPWDLAETLRGLTPQQVDIVTRSMALLTSAARMGMTSASPIFLFNNFSRDLMQRLTVRGLSLPWLSEWGRAWFELLTEGLAGWAREHAGSAVTGRLSARVAEGMEQVLRALERPVLGPLGRQHGEFLRAGAGFAALTPQLRAMGPQADAVTLLRLPGTPRGLAETLPVVGGLWRAIKTPIELTETASELVEVANRLGTFREARRRGLAPALAAEQARTVTVDFARAGQAMRVANMWAPLLNARTQGILRNVRAMTEDPEGYAFRIGYLLALPTIATYAWNRLVFGDVYDEIPQQLQNERIALVVGRWTDAEGQTRPLYITIGLDWPLNAISLTLRHMMDAVWHSYHGRQRLEGAQRTGRTDAEFWLTQIAQALPFNLQASDLRDPWTLIAGILSLNPVVGAVTQLGANWDRFYDRPIVPEESVYRLLQPVDRSQPGTPLAARLLGRALGVSPDQVAFAARTFGGSAATFFMGALDWPIRVLTEAGLVDARAFRPAQPEDLALPPDTPAPVRALVWERLAREDYRPWVARFLPMVFRTASSQQTLRVVAQQLSPEERQRVEQTRAFFSEWELERTRLLSEREALHAAPGEFTHRQLREREAAAAVQRREAFNLLKQRYPQAITDAATREAFYRTLPRLPVDRYLDSLVDLPPGVTPAQLAERYAAATAGARDLAEQRRRGEEAIRRIAAEVQLAPEVVRDYIAAYRLGQELPALGIPALALEEAVNLWLAPPGVDLARATPRQLGDARQRVVRDLAAQWGVAPEDLGTRIRTRLYLPLEQTDLSRSLERAQALYDRTHDPARFPRYVDRAGHALGTPEDWEAWDQALDRAVGQYGRDRRRWPAALRALEASRRYGEVARLQEQFQDPAYPDYARWYGIGRDMTVAQWEAFMSGQQVRYRAAITPQQALQWDALYRLYVTLPEGPEKAALRPYARRIRALAVPRWRAWLDQEAAEAGDAEPPS